MIALVDKFDLGRDLYGVQEGCLFKNNLVARGSFDLQLGVWTVIENPSGDAIRVDVQQPIIRADGFEREMTDNLRLPVIFDWA